MSIDQMSNVINIKCQRSNVKCPNVTNVKCYQCQMLSMSNVFLMSNVKMTKKSKFQMSCTKCPNVKCPNVDCQNVTNSKFQMFKSYQCKGQMFIKCIFFKCFTKVFTNVYQMRIFQIFYKSFSTVTRVYELFFLGNDQRKTHSLSCCHLLYIGANLPSSKVQGEHDFKNCQDNWSPHCFTDPIRSCRIFLSLRIFPFSTDLDRSE